jgi:hypothetical protein
VFRGHKGHEFVMPELDLFLRGERRHVVNYRRFFLCDFTHLARELDQFRIVPPHLGVVPAVQTVNIDQSSFMISLLSRVAEFAVLLQLLIVIFQQRFNARIRGNVFVPVRILR